MNFRKTRNLSDFAIRFAVMLCLFTASLWLAACSNQQPSDEQIKQQAAQTTKQVKQGAQQAAADAKVAAANAARKLNDVAAGVKDGLKSGKPGAGTVDINSASEEQLVDLPGITGARAQRIIHNRPYSNPHDLVSKGILTDEQFGRISGQVVAN